MPIPDKAVRNVVIAIGIAPETGERTFEPPIVVLELPDYDSLNVNQHAEYDQLCENIDAGDAMDGCQCITDIPGIYVADYVDYAFKNVRIIKRRNFHAISDD